MGLPFIWVRGTPALVSRVAGVFRAGRRVGDCSMDLAALQLYLEEYCCLIGDVYLPLCGDIFSGQYRC